MIFLFVNLGEEKHDCLAETEQAYALKLSNLNSKILEKIMKNSCSKEIQK